MVAPKLEGHETCEKNGSGEDVVTTSIMDTSKKFFKYLFRYQSLLSVQLGLVNKFIFFVYF